MTSLFIRTSISLFLLSITYALIVTAKAGNKHPDISGKFELFGSDEPLKIVLETDLRKLLRNKRDDVYQEGKIKVNDQVYPIRMKARGNYRREHCSFPPVTLNFSKTEFEDKSFEQLKKLKLVNACKMQQSYQQYILKEFMIYKTFNLLTDKSFKVRLLKIQYVDTEEKIKTVTRYGFVIEDQFMLADRLDGVIIQRTGIRDESANRSHMVLVSLFQFMMGNTDWQVPRLHNLKLLRLNQVSEASPYVIPYDFDYTGMVNASYAIPSPILGIKSIRERLYWGKCYPEAELQHAIDLFLEKKTEIYALYRGFELLSDISLKESIDYLDSFFAIISNKKSWQRYFIHNCRN